MADLPENLRLETLLRGMPQFQPIAYYDKDLDAIRVQISDCSIWEERFDRIMTIYHMNHHLSGEGPHDVVGFAIKGVRALLAEFGMGTDGAIEVASLLHELVRKYPSTATRFAVEFYKEIAKQVPAELPLAAAA